MSEQPVTAAGLPKFDLADKMRKSLRHAGLSVQEMAAEFDVTPRTVSNWINGRVDPSAATAAQWALRTGIPYTWFCHGSLEPCDIAPRDASGGTSGRLANKMHKLPTRVVA